MTENIMPNEDAPRLTTEGAAAYLRERGVEVEDSTLKTLRNRARGPAFYRIAGRCRYAPRDLDAYIASCRVDPVEQG